MGAIEVVDADGHVLEPPDLWTARMEPKWGQWIPCYLPDDPEKSDAGSWYFGGVRRGGGAPPCAGSDPELALDDGRAAAADPDLRVRELDAEGIDAAFLYPSLALFFGPLDPIPALRNVAFVAACQRAYNDWLAEFCAAHPERLHGMAAVPLQDVKRAVAEVHRAVKRLGLAGVVLRPAAYGEGLPLSHRAYDPFWAACQELDVPVAFHPGGHVDTPGAHRLFELVREDPDLSVTGRLVDEVRGGAALGRAVGHTVDAMVTLGRVVLGGVCERFPRLRFLFLECGGGWLPGTLERMDAQVRAQPWESPWLSLLPSEYFRRQCWIAFDPEEATLPLLAERIGTDRIVWSSDFPFADPEQAAPAQRVRAHLAGLLAEDQQRILGANAARAYGLLPNRAPAERAGAAG